MQATAVINSGARLRPPPGCPRAVYKLMMECWYAHNPIMLYIVYMCMFVSRYVCTLLLAMCVCISLYKSVMHTQNVIQLQES